MTGRRVLGLGPYRLALEFREDSSAGLETISAFGEDRISRLESRQGDRKERGNVTIAELRPPSGLTAAQLFVKLEDLDDVYCDCLRYDLFPDTVAERYNSNSYIQGLIDSSGATVDFRGYHYYGILSPVPPESFKAAP